MSKIKPATKVSLLTQHLSRAKGATLAELEEATGWQQHSIRAALTGLRKKGCTIVRGKRGDVSFYRIVEAGS